MPKSLSTYLEELRSKKTPGYNPDNLYDRMYQSLEDLNEALNDEELSDEERYTKVSRLYDNTAQLVMDYNHMRVRSLFGASDWERSTGLLGQLYTDLTAQRSIFKSMGEPDQAQNKNYRDLANVFERGFGGREPGRKPAAQDAPGKQPLSELNLIDLDNKLRKEGHNSGKAGLKKQEPVIFPGDDALNDSSLDIFEAFGLEPGPEQEQKPENILPNVPPQEAQPVIPPVRKPDPNNIVEKPAVNNAGGQPAPQNGPARKRRNTRFDHIISRVTYNELNGLFDEYGQTFDRNNYVPQEVREVLGDGSISTGRRYPMPRNTVSFRNWERNYYESVLDLSAFEDASAKKKDAPVNKKETPVKLKLAEESFGNIFTTLQNRDSYLSKKLLSADFSKATDEEKERFINGELPEDPANGHPFLSDYNIHEYLEEMNPFKNDPEAAKSFRSAFLGLMTELSVTKTYVESRKTSEGDGYFEYVEHYMIGSHGYFPEPAGADKETRQALADKRKSLQAALNALSEVTYDHDAVLKFTDDTPEARSQFAYGIVKPEDQQYNAIESDEEFQQFVNAVNPFKENLDPDAVINESEEAKAARIKQAEEDTVVFRTAVFDMVTDRKRAYLDAVQREEKGFPVHYDLERNAAAATKLANSLGFGSQVEQVTRLRGESPTQKPLYFRAETEGIAPNKRNINDPELFAAEGAVLDSSSLAAKLCDIQAFRFLTGNTGKGLAGLRFTMSDDDPAQITGVIDTTNEYAFSTKQDDPQRSLDPDNIPAMRRSTANRIMAMTPELLKATLGSTVSPSAAEQAVTRLTRLQNAIRKGLEQKWPEKDALIAGRIHVMDDADFETLSVKQLAAVQGHPNNGLFSQVYSGVVLKGEAAAKENSSYPGGLYQKGMALLMETQEDKDSSPAFNRAMEGVKKLNRELVRYMKEDRPLTAEELPKLRKLYSECLGDVSQYVTATKGWHWTTRGDRRHNAMDTMQKFMEKELKALYDYEPSRNWKLEKIIAHARQEEITEIPAENNEKVGGNLNSREVMELNGKKGVFTERHNVDFSMETLHQRYLAGIDGQAYPDQDMLYAMQTAAETLFQKRDSLIKPFQHDVFFKSGFENKFANADAQFMDSENGRKLVSALNDAFRGKGLPTIDKTEASRPFRTALAGLLNKCSDIENERGLYQNAFLQHNDNIDQRNTAMTVTADLLESPNIIARAHDVRVRKGGQVREGTFMEWADGLGRDDINTNKDNAFKDVRSNMMTREALLDISDLQVADFISGNPDRHMGNAIFKFGKPENNEIRVKHSVGIDNDLSFGALFMKDLGEMASYQEKKKFIFPENMLMMRQSTANAVLNMTKDTVQVAYRPYIKSEKQLDAIWDRVQGVQKQLRKDANYRWKGPRSLAEGHIRVLQDDDPLWDSFRPGGLANTKTLFAKYDELALKAEGNKQFLPDNALKNHYFRSHLKKDHPHHNLMTRLDCHPMTEVTKLPYLQGAIKNEDGSRAADYAELYRSLGTGDIMNNDRFLFCGDTLFSKFKDSLGTLGYGGNVNQFFAHNGLHAAGFKRVPDLIYVDGVPYRDYVKDHLPSLANNEEYKQLVEQGGADFYDGSVIMALLTSGRHHVDLAVPGMDHQGRFCTDITELTMDLEKLKGTEGTFGTSRTSRHAKLLDDGTREARFRQIDNNVTHRMKQSALSLKTHFELKEAGQEGMKGFQIYRRPAEEYKDLLKEPVDLNEIVKIDAPQDQAGNNKNLVDNKNKKVPGEKPAHEEHKPEEHNVIPKDSRKENDINDLKNNGSASQGRKKK